MAIRKVVAANIDFEVAGGRDKGFGGKIVIGVCALLAIESLYKSVMPAVQPQRNTGNEGKGILLGWVHELEIPTFEIIVPTAPAVVAVGVPEGAPAVEEVVHQEVYSCLRLYCCPFDKLMVKLFT